MGNRISKRVDDTLRTGKRIDEILPGILAEIGQRAKDPFEAVSQEWFLIIGDKMAPFTQPVSLRDSILSVKVKSSTLYSLLCQHEKQRLLKKLQEKFPIRDLVFRIG